MDERLRRAAQVEVGRNADLQADVQQHEEEVKSIRKRHRSIGPASSSAGVQGPREDGEQGPSSASGCSSGSQAVDEVQHHKGQKLTPDVRVRDLQAQSE